MKDLTVGVLFIALYLSALSLVGCDKEQFQKDHPVESEVIEKMAEGAESLVEGVAETELHVPAGSLGPVFQHKIFEQDIVNSTKETTLKPD